VRTIADRAAGLQKLDSEVLPLTPDLVELLHKAEDKRRITALVVDPWSVQLQSYRELMRKFDDAQDLRAGAVLVPWNEGDSETAVMSKQLEATLHDVFNNLIYNRPYYFRNRIPDADALTHELSIVFNLHLKRQMSARPAVGKKVLTMPTLGAKDEAASILRSGLARGLRIPAAAGLAVSRQLLNPGVL
jgi:FxsC-like protein